jgi:hypothetical protein
MEDIISHGGSSAGGWRRRAAVVAVLIAIAALIVARHVGHSVTAGPGKGNPGAAGQVHRAPSHRLIVIASPAERWAAAVRMPWGGIQPAWLRPSTGAVQPIGGLPRYGFGYRFTRMQGGWILQLGSAAQPTCGDCSIPTSSSQAGCVDCPGPPSAVYYLGVRSRAARMIGLATMAAPATATGSAWLTTFPTTSGLGTSAGIAREYGSTGRMLGPAVRLPTGYKIVQGTRKGLLLTAIAGRQYRDADRLWNPRTRKMIRTYRNVIGVTAAELAIARSGATGGELQVLDLVTGYRRTLRITHGVPVAGEFSPDGRYLALEVRSGSGPESGTRIQVATLATGHVIAVPGSAAGGGALSGFGWPGLDDYLAAVLSSRAGVEIAYWNAATSRAASARLADLDPRQLTTG